MYYLMIRLSAVQIALVNSFSPLLSSYSAKDTILQYLRQLVQWTFLKGFYILKIIWVPVDALTEAMYRYF